MSMHDCVFYYWSDEQWDSCDKFREAATPILNPTNIPGLLDWRASGTQAWPLSLSQFENCKRSYSEDLHDWLHLPLVSLPTR